MTEFSKPVAARQDALGAPAAEAPFVPRVEGEVGRMKDKLRDPFVRALAAIADGGRPPAGSIPGGILGMGGLSIGLSRVAEQNGLKGTRDAAAFLVKKDLDELNKFKEMLSSSERPDPKPLFR